MKIIFKFYLLIIILLFSAIACTKKDKDVIFIKEEIIKEDATKAWLRKVENYKKNKNYLTVFYTYYNNNLKKNNYLNAAETLDIACLYLTDSYDFNTKFLTTQRF